MQNMSQSSGIGIRMRISAVRLLLLTVIVRFTSVHADPGRLEVNANFRSVPTTVKAEPNDTIELPCNHHSSHQYVRWIREGTVLCDTREPDLHPPERFRLLDNGNLALTDVRNGDTGEYACEVMTAHGLATQTHAIEVLLAPTIVSVPSGTVEVPIGSVFEIVCEPAGVPYPAIEWRHRPTPDGRQLDGDVPMPPLLTAANQTSSRRMLVQVSDRRLAGRIDCIANNGVGQAQAGIALLVLFTPEVRSARRLVHTRIGLRAYLECESIAHPAASVHWFRNDEPLAIGSHHLQQHTVLNDDSPMDDGQDALPAVYTRSKHVLIVKNVRDTDLGRYVCRASNRIGYRGAEMELTGRPLAAVFKTSPLASTPLSHNLIWQTESLSPIIEYVLRFRQVPSGNLTPHRHRQQQHHQQHRHRHYDSLGDWTELVVPSTEPDSYGPVHSVGYALRGLMPATVYEVMVVARNRYGVSDPSTMIRFATGGEIEVPNYSTESAEYTSAASYERSDHLSSAEADDGELAIATTSVASPAEAAQGDDYGDYDSALSRAGGRFNDGVLLGVALLIAMAMRLCVFQ